jgi:hypothetical protein
LKKSLILIFLVLLWVLISSSCSNIDDGGWKDTHKIYENTDYEILNHSRDGKIIRGINNRKYNQCIVDEILGMEETNEMVYVYGEFTKHPIYAVIDIVDNKVKMYAEVEEGDTLCMTQLYNMIKAGDAMYLNNYEEFSNSEREAFERLGK